MNTGMDEFAGLVGKKLAEGAVAYALLLSAIAKQPSIDGPKLLQDTLDALTPEDGADEKLSEYRDAVAGLLRTHSGQES
jgi:hypothetical protein